MIRAEQSIGQGAVGALESLGSLLALLGGEVEHPVGVIAHILPGEILPDGGLQFFVAGCVGGQEYEHVAVHAGPGAASVKDIGGPRVSG